MHCDICDYSEHQDSIYSNGLTYRRTTNMVRYRPRYKSYLCSECFHIVELSRRYNESLDPQVEELR